ncbi:hypothetical protein PUNSTDRAFT_91924, partial [Punctularia strigosozonata HHB-11173 SS5]
MEEGDGAEGYDCICRVPQEIGSFGVACDKCGRWCHGVCVGLLTAPAEDEVWRCWQCDPSTIDRVMKAQRERARLREEEANRQREREMLEREGDKVRRRGSPGVERKRKVGASDGSGAGVKRKRRSSTSVAHITPSTSWAPQTPVTTVPPPLLEPSTSRTSQQPHPATEEDHIDIDSEPWASSTYVPITSDIIPYQETRDLLKHHAQRWRGMSALEPPIEHPPDPYRYPYSTTPVDVPYSAFTNPPPTILHPGNTTHPSSTSTSARPAPYALHTAQPLPASTLITPYLSTILPSAVYLADELNGYAHTGLPRAHVHLVGPPIDVALDARGTGNQGRWVRSGCRPNAVIRPVLCNKGKGKGKERMREHAMDLDEQPAEAGAKDDKDEETLSFAVFALRDLKAHEEVILGWEWDDGCVVHKLPALIERPWTFPPHQFRRLRDQMSMIVNTLASSFTTCACGSSAKDCALNLMSSFVDSPGQVNLERMHGFPFPDTLDPRKHVEDPGGGDHIDLGPLIGRERGFRTRERVPWSGGIGGVEMVPQSAATTPYGEPEAPGGRRRHGKTNKLRSDHAISLDRGNTVNEVARAFRSMQSETVDESMLPPSLKRRKFDPSEHASPRKGKGKGKDVEEWDSSVGKAERQGYDDADEDMEDATAQPEHEKEMPPRLRKGWIRDSLDALREGTRLGSVTFDQLRDDAVGEADAWNSAADERATHSAAAASPEVITSPERSIPTPVPRSPSPAPTEDTIPPHVEASQTLAHVAPDAAHVHNHAPAITGPVLSPSTRFSNLSLDSPLAPPAPTPRSFGLASLLNPSPMPTRKPTPVAAASQSPRITT